MATAMRERRSVKGQAKSAERLTDQLERELKQKSEEIERLKVKLPSRDIPESQQEDFTFPAGMIERHLDLLVTAVSDHQHAGRLLRAIEARACEDADSPGDADSYGRATVQEAKGAALDAAQTLRTYLTWFRETVEGNFAPTVRTLVRALACDFEPEQSYPCRLSPEEDSIEQKFGALVFEWRQLSWLLDIDAEALPSEERLQKIILHGAMTLSLLRAQYRSIGYPVQHREESNYPQAREPSVVLVAGV